MDATNSQPKDQKNIKELQSQKNTQKQSQIGQVKFFEESLDTTRDMFQTSAECSSTALAEGREGQAEAPLFLYLAERSEKLRSFHTTNLQQTT